MVYRDNKYMVIAVEGIFPLACRAEQTQQVVRRAFSYKHACAT